MAWFTDEEYKSNESLQAQVANDMAMYAQEMERIRKLIELCDKASSLIDNISKKVPEITTKLKTGRSTLANGGYVVDGKPLLDYSFGMLEADINADVSRLSPISSAISEKKAKLQSEYSEISAKYNDLYFAIQC